MTPRTADDRITSPANPRVRAAAALRDADARRSTGLTLVDGRREIARAGAAGVEVVDLFVAVDALAPEPTAVLPAWVVDLAGAARITALAERPFARVAYGGRDEGVVAVVRFAARPLAAATFAADRPLLVVEGVEKPGNLGAIVRTADAAGLAGVVVCDGRTDPANPAVIRASLGTVFGVPLAVDTTAATLARLAADGRRVITATPAGTRLWHEAALSGHTALVLGSEARGLSSAWAEARAAGGIELESVRLPMHGAADSLNLSVTAAVLAYEALRQEGVRP